MRASVWAPFCRISKEIDEFDSTLQRCVGTLSSRAAHAPPLVQSACEKKKREEEARIVASHAGVGPRRAGTRGRARA